jgi:hypothetical protein
MSAKLTTTERPIHLGGYTLHALGMEVTGKPSFEDHLAVGCSLRSRK